MCYLHISRVTYLLIWYRPKKYAVALGSSSTASGEYSYASGYNSVASGNKSYAAGYASVASAESSVVIGDSRQVKPEADQGVAVGSKATVKNKAKQRVVVGSEAKVNAERGIAIGKEAKAGGTLLDGPAYYADAIAVGYQAEAGKGGAIALGKQAKATKQNGMALGVESEAAGDFSTAVGNESKAKGQGGVGLGNQSKAEADFAVAVGNKAEATKENSLVIGRYARANGNHSVSLGSRSEIKDGVSNSVAPGYGSVASENNVVSVAYKETPQSTELSYRKIVGVDDGVNDFDAVNVRQSKAMQGQNMAELFSVRSEVRGVAASSAALSALTPLSYDANNPTQFMVGFGTYKGRQAMALGLSHFVNDRFMVKVGGTLGGNKTGHMMNVGLTWKFGTSQGVPATSDKVLMEQLMQDNRQLKARLEKLEARLNAM
ncbi:surface exposed protein [Neisseria gonorrhoeae]